MKSYDCFQTAFVAALQDLKDHGEVVDGVCSPRSIGSHFGTAMRPFIEIQGGGFRLLDPRRRWLVGSPRKPNAAFAAANVILTLSGGHDVDMIAEYNSRGRQFAEDDSRFESAFGSRLFSPGHQLVHVRKKLQEDKSSRRAVALVYNPEDTLLDRLDTPCAIALQFLIRKDRLDCICFMRSQSAAMVMPYDVFLFTMLQEWLAVELEVELGIYTHICGSLHFYDEDRAIVEAILTGGGSAPAMAKMISAGQKTAASVVETERRLRLLDADESTSKVTEKLDSYWREFFKPLIDFHTASTADTYFV